MSGFITEIYEQPATLHHALDIFSADVALLDALHQWGARLRMGELKGIVFTGMGSSFHATWPAALILEEHNIYASVIEASELAYYGHIDARTLVVAVSQSGRSVEVVKLVLSQARSNG